METYETVVNLNIPSVFKVAILKTVQKIDAAAAELQLDSLYLFGSCARSEAQFGSDVDLLLVTAAKTEREILEDPLFSAIDDDTANPPIQLTVRKIDILSKCKSECLFNNTIQRDLILLRKYKR